jgi:hypothetical protein
MEDWVQWSIAAVCLVVTVILQAEVALLFIGAGIVGILYYGHFFPRRSPIVLEVGAAPALALVPAASGSTLGKLLLFFLKAGSLTFGSGLVIVPFLEQGLVQQYGWLDQRQFLIAVAVGMVSPGPVVITATFVGYLGGLLGLAGFDDRNCFAILHPGAGRSGAPRQVSRECERSGLRQRRLCCCNRDNSRRLHLARSYR